MAGSARSSKLQQLLLRRGWPTAARAASSSSSTAPCCGPQLPFLLHSLIPRPDACNWFFTCRRHPHQLVRGAAASCRTSRISKLGTHTSRKSSLQQQLQQQLRVPSVRSSASRLHGSDLAGISQPHLHVPDRLTDARTTACCHASFHPDQHRASQSACRTGPRLQSDVSRFLLVLPCLLCRPWQFVGNSDENHSL